MISLKRSLIKSILSVFKRALRLRGSRSLTHPLEFAAGASGLMIRAHTLQHAASYQELGNFEECRLVVPWQLLKEVASTKHDVVTLSIQSGKVTATWQEGAVPRTVTHDAPEFTKAFPAEPEKFAKVEVGFLRAMADAMEVTDQMASRYALGCVQLRGSGVIAATDGRQALRHVGFEFPFNGELLVPASDLFACKEVATARGVMLGKTDLHLVVRADSWTFYLEIAKEGRFPRVDDIIPAHESASTIVELAASDRDFLVDNLPRLAGEKDADSPVTVELNGAVVIRAKGEGDSNSSQLVLSNSRNLAEDEVFATNRRYLQRAAQLGLPTLRGYGNNSAVLCHDDRRSYVWMTLNPSCIVSGDGEGVRIESPRSQSGSPRQSSTKHRISTMAKRRQVSESTAETTPVPETVPKEPMTSEEPVGPVEQALRLHAALREALTATSGLVRMLKRRKKEQQQLQSTLASLRQLQEVA